MQEQYTPNHGTFPECPGIYRITCTITGKFYVGSANNLRKRQKDHRYHLNKGDHGSPKLLNAWKKYGKDAFVFDVLELVLIPEMLTAREQYYFAKLKPFGTRGFNIDRVAGSRLGSKQSPEAIAKSAAARRGKPGGRLGQKASPETREKLRLSHMGKTLSEESRRKVSEAVKNRPPASAETCEKIRLSKLGHVLSAEGRAKMIASKTGHTYTPEVYASRMKTLIVTAPDGTEHMVTGVKRFCKDHNLDCSSLMRVAKGEYSQHKGYKARYSN